MVAAAALPRHRWQRRDQIHRAVAASRERLARLSAAKILSLAPCPRCGPRCGRAGRCLLHVADQPSERELWLWQREDAWVTWHCSHTWPRLPAVPNIKRLCCSIRQRCQARLPLLKSLQERGGIRSLRERTRWHHWWVAAGALPLGNLKQLINKRDNWQLKAPASCF